MIQRKPHEAAPETVAQPMTDADYARMREEAQRRREVLSAKRAIASRPVLEELHQLGYMGDDLLVMAQRYAPLKEDIVGVYLKWVTQVEDDRICECIVRGLSATRLPYDGGPLIQVFERTSNESLKWAIGNTMAFANPEGVTEWLLRATADPASGKSRQMLVLALVRRVPASIAIPIILPLFDELEVRVPVARALGKIGGEPELKFLEEKLPEYQPPRSHAWIKREMEKAAQRIRRRIEKASVAGRTRSTKKKG